MKNYKLWNKLLAWITFSIAAFTYLSTLEPSVSFWDCGEFIAAADKLMICHPPGAPLFLMIARVFALMAPSPDKVALMINAMSALCSAFTILFLFWTITHLSKKLLVGSEELSKGKALAVLGSGLVGALAYTFTDSFWFSAVEGEVYAMSSLFTAVVFWAILRWEDEATQPHALRWLVLIGLLLGLSIGVHLLNLLAIPAIALVYYYKTQESPTIKGILTTLFMSVLTLGFIMYGVIPGTVKLSAYTDLFFVNTLKINYNSGMVFFIALLFGTLGYGIYWSQKKGKVILNTALSFFLVLFIGYSSFAMVMIRSNAKPAMNQNAPNDAFSLLSYLNREQYGERPLIYGQQYNTPVVKHKETGVRRDQVRGKYEVVGTKHEREYDDQMTTLFPRMWSDQSSHIQEYKRWAKIKGKKVKAADGKVLDKPTMQENLRYLVRYQLGHMYARYFMWNFVGRQNDQPGHGSLANGNWLSGIGFIDKALLGGDQDQLPDLIKNDKSRNTYYFLPFILGLFGIVFQLSKRNKRGNQSFVIVTALFILTGIAIVVYLNQYPLQPRERDYAYAASFYAFAIWIGLGVLFLWKQLSKITTTPYAAIAATTICLSIPTLLAYENWDDHNRSNRFVAHDTAYNYLISCAPNAILFTFADNDTFPIWYLQEVEGVRTDVRVCNLTYLSTEWYIEHMRSATVGAEPVKFTLDNEQTRMAQNDVVYLVDYSKKSIAMSSAVAWLKSDNPKTKMLQGQRVPHLPATQFHLDINAQQIIDNGIVALSDSSHIVKQLELDYSDKRVIYKNNMMMLDLLASNNWERPLYYATSVSPNLHFGLETYFQMCGQAYQVVPIKAKGAINTELMYDNLMHKYRYGNVKDSSIYLDNDVRKQASQMRNNFVSLAKALHQEGKDERARQVMRKCLTEIPSSAIPYHVKPPYQNVFPLVDTLLKIEMKNEAVKIIAEMHHHTKQEMDYFLTFDYQHSAEIQAALRQRLSAYYQLTQLINTHIPQKGKVVKQEFESYYDRLDSILKS